MSAPPLPDIFGNYVLGDEFVEVVAPAAVYWLPQTAGWAWLGGIALLLLLRYAWRRLRHWYRNRYRREAAVQLRALGNAPADEHWLEELNRLLKLTALAAFSREQVASLSGTAWVEFLNSRCEQPPFSTTQGELLAEAIYRRTLPAANERAQLLSACLRWVEGHERTAGV